MALEWQELPQETSVNANRSPRSASTDDPPVVSSSNPWFAVAVGLLGFIAGYVIGQLV